MKLQAILATSFLIGVTASAMELKINGGKVVPVESKIIETYKDDMNFCFASRYSDGEIHLNHSKGVHTITEFQCTDWSPDNGKTWINNSKNKKIFGINSCEFPDGTRMQIGCWTSEIKKVHTLSVTTQTPEQNKKNEVTTYKCNFEIPFEANCLTHREIVILKNGNLIAPAYCHVKGEKGNRIFLICSEDKGKTWKYLSTLASDPDGKTPEGPNESTIVQLADGTLYAAWRDGGFMKYAYSSDNGKTWGQTYEFKGLKMAVAPHAKLLANGALVMVTGRPYFHLLVDWTGTGKNFQVVDIYTGSGSSYGSIFEIAPNRVMIIHDESHFSAWRNNSQFSKLVAETYDIVKDDSIKVGSGDPRAVDFKRFYSPFDGKDPKEAEVAVFYEYFNKKKKADAIANFEIMTVPEHPYPIMRITSKGNNNLVPRSEWPTFRSHALPKDATTLKTTFCVRIQDNDVDKPQFMVIGKVAVGDKMFAATVQIGKDFVKFHNSNAVKGNFMGKFTTFDLVVDGLTQKAQLFRHGETTPLIETKLNADTNSLAAGGVWWGDGSGQVYGTADLAYIGWTW
ncbi:MAG: exo-alpha-sialidase [Lentisphaeria bacterium]|nr:exo-alpha-sialidase [Lentisphaeria bacterium]